MKPDPRKSSRRGSTATGEEIGYDVGNDGAMKRPAERIYGPDRVRQPITDYGYMLYVVPGVNVAPGLPQVFLRCERHAPPNGRPIQYSPGQCVGCLAEQHQPTITEPME